MMSRPVSVAPMARAFVDPIMGTAGPVLELARPEGATLADLVALVPLSDEAIRPHLVVRLDGEDIAPQLLRRIKPKAHAFVTLHLPVGGGDGGKLLSTIAAIALIGASLFVGSFGIPFLGSAFAAGSIGANLVAGGLSVAAAMLLQGLNPSGSTDNQVGREVGSASANNTFEPFGYLQRVIGTRKVAPKMIMPPWTSFEGDDQIIYLAYGLSGPHRIEEVRVGYAKVEDDANIEIETREGFADDAPVTLVTNTVIEQQVGIAMTDFVTISSTEASNQLDTSLSTNTPQWHRLETRDDPAEAVINFSLPGGLFNLSPSDPDSDAQVAGVTAIRVRIRKVGQVAWRNLPEFVLRGRRGQDAIRFALRFVWCDAGDIPAVTAFTANWKGFSWKYNTVNDAASIFSADAYFAGDVIDWEDGQHVTAYLDAALFDPGRYEFEVIRGQTIHSALWNAGAHTLNTTWSTFFDAAPGSPPTLVRGINNYVRAIRIDTVQSVFDEHPFDFSGQPTAVIVMRARNRSINQVTCIASGYLPDWDGADWVPDQVSANPASAYRHVLADDLNARPVPLPLIGGPELVALHEWCRRRRLEANVVIEGQPVAGVISTIAQAGFFRPSYGAPYRPVIDRQREVAGLVTQRNAGRFSFQKPFTQVAHGLRVSFADAARDYEVREIVVYADGFNADGTGGLEEATRFESVSYAAITSESTARARARRDLRTARHRSTLVMWQQDIEHLEFQMGSRLLVETDILGRHGGRGRIAEVLLDGSDEVEALRLDEHWNFDHADANSLPRALTIRCPDGGLLTAEVTGDDTDPHLVTFTTPFAMPTYAGGDLVVPGALVVTGTLGRVARDVIAWDIAPGPGLTASITAIDYAEDAIYGVSAWSDGFSNGFGNGLN
jgi:hypothetical protein